jgi:hypothetical protein
MSEKPVHKPTHRVALQPPDCREQQVEAGAHLDGTPWGCRRVEALSVTVGICPWVHGGPCAGAAGAPFPRVHCRKVM